MGRAQGNINHYLTMNTDIFNDPNAILLSDSYKLGGHWNMFLPGTTSVSAYLEARMGALFSDATFFGLQHTLKKYMVGPVVTRAKIEEAAEISADHFGTDAYFNRPGWEYILNKHGGYLPLRIRALPEGMTVPVSNVLMTTQNTDPIADEVLSTRWLSAYYEGLLQHVWYGSTVATLSREVKKIAKHYLGLTAESDAGLPFMLHDFGFRGASSVESASVGGAAHLLNFLGTDTVPALKLIRDYYGMRKGIGYSVAASEHNNMCAAGRDGEPRIVKLLLDRYQRGILSVVGDTYDIEHFANHIIGVELKDQIMKRDGVFVLRPDSGDPEEITLKCLEILGAKFGFTINAKGYRVLNPKVRVIYGDGLDIDKIRGILGRAYVNGWSAENLVFGMGGGLLQKVNRDDMRFAFKGSAHERDGVWHDVYKAPKEGGKTSKRGRLKLVNEGGVYTTRRLEEPGEDLLVTVYENGELKVDHNFVDIRARAAL